MKLSAKSFVAGLIVTLALIAVGCGAGKTPKETKFSYPQPDHSQYADGLYAEFYTNKGVIVCRLQFERAPLTVTNFVGLAEGTKDSNKNGQPFYDGLTFHMVEKDFMIQSGSPNAEGNGYPGYGIYDEIDTGLKHKRPGILSMANFGPDSGGSQFFITRKATPQLNGKNAVFGHVTIGMDVVNKIVKGDLLQKVEIVRKGKKAEAFKADQAAFVRLEKDLVERRRKKILSRDGLYAKIDTTQGLIICKLEFEKVPLTVINFVGLAEGSIKSNKNGKPFFDDMPFYNVRDQVWIKSGCPQGDGNGGPGYTFKNERHSALSHLGKGMLLMDNAVPDANGSCFWIMRSIERGSLRYFEQYPVFGQVEIGMRSFYKIRATDRINKITIVRVGEKAKAFKADQAAFDAQKKKIAEAAEARRKEAQAKLAKLFAEDGLYAKIHTSKGMIICKLEYEKAPLTVTNFVGLAEGTIKSNKDGQPFYDGLTFHRSEGVVIQGGDPMANGSGGPGYAFFNEVSPALKHTRGALSMANAGPHTNGSQIFIVKQTYPDWDMNYNAFGYVSIGMDVVDRIQVGDVIKKVEIVRKGAKARAFKVSQESFDKLNKEAAAKWQGQ